MSRGRELAKVGGLTQTISGISTFVGISTFASDVRIHGKLDVDGDISYDEMTSVNSKVTGVSTLTDARVDRNLYVAGITTVTGALDVNGGGTIDNIQIGVTGDNEIDTASGSLTIDSAGGTVTVDDNLTVSGNTVLNGNIDLGNATGDTISATGRFDTDIVPSTDGARDLGSSTLEFKDLYIDGTANIDAAVLDTAIVSDLTNNRVVIAGASGEIEDDANLTFDGATLAVGVALDVDGHADLDNVSISGVTTITGASTFTGAIDANGGATIDNIQIGITGNNEIDTSSGNLTLDSAGGTVAIDDTVTVSGDLTVTGASVFNGTIDLGNATSDTITATARFDSDIVPSTDGARDLGSSTLEFKDLYIDGTANIDAAILDTAQVSDLTDNRVVIAGASGELEDDANLTFNGTTLAVGVALDVDGHLDADNVSISGIATITGASTFTGAIDANGGATIDNIQIGITGDNELDTSSGNLTIDSAGGTTTIDDNATVTGNLTVTGDLQVNGTNTVVASTTMTVADKNIVVAQGAANDAAADGAGVTVDSGDGDKTWNWVDSTDAWTSSEHINLASGKGYELNGTTVLSGTTLGSSIVTSSLTSVGTVASGTWEGTAVANDYIATITAANKVSLSAINIDGGTDIGADLADGDEILVDDGGGGTNRRSDIDRIYKYVFSKVSGDVAISATGTATIQANSVALTTDTTGNYVQQGATSGNGLSGSVNSEGGTFTVTSNATNANTASTIVYRDGSGDFSAGTITANLTGTATNATHVVLTDNESTNENNLIPFAEDTSATGNVGLETDGDFHYNPSTGSVTATVFIGSLTGNADTATTATTATNVTVSANNTANETCYPLLVDGATGGQGAETDTALSYNPSTNTLTVGTVSGALSGTATNAALLDSLDSSQFLRSDAADTMTGTLTMSGNIVPNADSSRDLGTNSVRWANIYGDDIYAGDIHMSNEHKGGNTIDGTWGSYLFEEGESDLFITNRRSGKKFRLVLEAI